MDDADKKLLIDLVQRLEEAVGRTTRPSALYCPNLRMLDTPHQGCNWVAELPLGPNRAITGYSDTPASALRAFDRAFESHAGCFIRGDTR